MKLDQYINILKNIVVKGNKIDTHPRNHEMVKRFLQQLHRVKNGCVDSVHEDNSYKCYYGDRCSNVEFFYIIMLAQNPKVKLPKFPFIGCNAEHSVEQAATILEEVKKYEDEIKELSDIIDELYTVVPEDESKTKTIRSNAIDGSGLVEITIPYFDASIFVESEFKVEKGLKPVPKSKAQLAAETAAAKRDAEDAKREAAAAAKRGVTKMHAAPDTSFSKVDKKQSFAQKLGGAPAAKSSATVKQDDPIVAPRAQSAGKKSQRKSKQLSKEEKMYQELLRIKTLMEKEKEDRKRREEMDKRNKQEWDSITKIAKEMGEMSPQLREAFNKMRKTVEKKNVSDSSTSDSGSSESDQE